MADETNNPVATTSDKIIGLADKYGKIGLWGYLITLVVEKLLAPLAPLIIRWAVACWMFWMTYKLAELYINLNGKK